MGKGGGGEVGWGRRTRVGEFFLLRIQIENKKKM